MPKRKRSFRTRKRSSSAPAVLRSPARPSKRKRWGEELMIAAISAVKSGVPVKRAAEEHGVPRTTLRD